MNRGYIAKTKKGSATRERIFNAALDLIKTKGYDQTTLVDICQQADIATGTFYHYFHSKQDIIIAYVKQESDDLIDYFNSLNKDSWAQVLLTIIAYQADYFLRKGHEFVANFYAIMLITNNAYYNYYEFSLIGIVTECFERGQSGGEFTAAFSPQYMSDLAIALLYMLTTAWCIEKSASDLRQDLQDKFQALLMLFKA